MVGESEGRKFHQFYGKLVSYIQRAWGFPAMQRRFLY